MGAQMQHGAYSRVCGASTAKRPAALGYAGTGPAQRATGSRLSGAARRQDPLREQRVPRHTSGWLADRTRHTMNGRSMRIVAHIDMDAFYAAIEERDTPRFRGLPLAVGADPEGGKGRGVVAAANYKARAYGIHSAMPISTAWRLSEAARRQGKPPVVFLSVDMKKYAEVSQRVMAIIRGFAPVVEEAGIDEAYTDLSFRS